MFAPFVAFLKFASNERSDRGIIIKCRGVRDPGGGEGGVQSSSVKMFLNSRFRGHRTQSLVSYILRGSKLLTDVIKIASPNNHEKFINFSIGEGNRREEKGNELLLS